MISGFIILVTTCFGMFFSDCILVYSVNVKLFKKIGKTFRMCYNLVNDGY